VADAQVLGQLLEGLAALEQQLNGILLEGFIIPPPFRVRFL